MRYLTNQLGWQSDRLSERNWVDHQGEALSSQFCFGGSHGWQTPVGFRQVFASEPLTREMASSWLTRDSYTSLISGPDKWSDFLTELLGLAVPMHQFEDDNQDHRFLLGEGDIVLRVGYACAPALPDRWSKRYIEDLPQEELISLLKEEPDLLRFYLHFIREFKPGRSVAWDAGL